MTSSTVRMGCYSSHYTRRSVVAISVFSGFISLLGYHYNGSIPIFGIQHQRQTLIQSDTCFMFCQDNCNTRNDSSTKIISDHKGLVSLKSIKKKSRLLNGIAYLDNLSFKQLYECAPSKRAQVLKKNYLETYCHKQMSFLDRSNPIVALVSFQGSGNTWVRHLLEQASGIYTGSIYCDTTLKAVFPGEYIVSANVLAVKTHHPDTAQLPDDVQEQTGKNKYNKAILLVRNPFDALVSEANRRWSEKQHTEKHLGVAKESAFIGNSKWDWFVEYKVVSWLVMLNTWLKESHIPIHVVQYENLKTNLTLEVQKMVQFLDIPVSNETLQCVAKNSEGLFKRIDHLNFDPFSIENKDAVNRILNQAKPLLSKYGIHYHER